MGYDPKYGVNPPGLFGDPNVDPMWDNPGYDSIGSNGVMNPQYETPIPGMDDQKILYGNGAPQTGQNQDWSWMNQGGNQGGGVWDYLKQVTGIDGGAGGGMDPRQAALFAASMGMAGKQWNDAGKYMDKTNEWAGEANPFGSERDFYKGELHKLYTDPSYLENMPAYKARMAASLNTLGPQLAAKGGGYGNAAGEMIKSAQNIASTEFDNEAKRLGNLAGAQFGPEAAARMRMQGLDASVRSENAALGSLMFPFGAGGMMNGNGPGQNNNRTGGGNQGGGGGFNPAQIAQLAQASGLNPAQVVNILKGMGNGPEAAEFIRNYGGPNNQIGLLPDPTQTQYPGMDPGGFNPTPPDGFDYTENPFDFEDFSQYSGFDPSQFDWGGLDPNIFNMI